MVADRNRYVRETLDEVRRLIVLADEGEAASADDGCVVLFSIVRDCAYKIRGRAERERDVHKLMGIWEADSPGDISKTEFNPTVSPGI
jgi:hypothetical protein